MNDAVMSLAALSTAVTYAAQGLRVDGGSGTCIIDNQGRCWCGQQWDGQKMVHPSLPQAEGPGLADVAEPLRPLTRSEP